MPIFQLGKSIVFPPVELAEPEGILAVGGDLSVKRLLAAYRAGIFPWYSDGEPIMWWSPDPRFVLFPDKLKVSDSMRRVMKQGRFEITFDTDFAAVITNCGRTKRKGQRGTWVTDDIIAGYCALHKAGHAHSVEVREKGELVGGLYGVAVGKCFCGESMFAKVPNASKAGFIRLVEKLRMWEFDLIDCQVPTDHLRSLGAVEMPRAEFVARLAAATSDANWRAEWTL